jgi:hypothetical protein
MKSELVFRKPLFYVIAVCVAVGCLAAFIVGAISNPNGSWFFGAVIFTAFVYFFWLVGWQSSVRVVSAGVIVDNLLSRSFIPWRDISEIKGGNGLLIVTRSRERIGSLMYGGSIIGMFTGSRQSRAVASKIKDAQEKLMAAGGPNDNVGGQTFRSVVNFQIWPFLIPLAAMELITGVSYVLH